jgi:hypothetical protein
VRNQRLSEGAHQWRIQEIHGSMCGRSLAMENESFRCFPQFFLVNDGMASWDCSSHIWGTNYCKMFLELALLPPCNYTDIISISVTTVEIRPGVFWTLYINLQQRGKKCKLNCGSNIGNVHELNPFWRISVLEQTSVATVCTGMSAWTLAVSKCGWSTYERKHGHRRLVRLRSQRSATTERNK